MDIPTDNDRCLFKDDCQSTVEDTDNSEPGPSGLQLKTEF